MEARNGQNINMAENSGYKHYVAGLLAGVSTVIVCHPFDTVKVNLQKHNTEAHGMKYQKALHCTTRILRTEGEGVQNGKPQLHAIFPAEAFGGAIISFILCPTELVKASRSDVSQFVSAASVRHLK